MITIIPAIDIIEGQCVRLTQGDYAQVKIYAKNPTDVAKQYEDMGITRLHVVDLDGAKSSAPKNLKILESIAVKTSLKVQWGGGVKSTQSLSDVFNAGARYAICGSIAVSDGQLFNEWLEKFSGAKIILGADVRNGRVAVNGWQEDVELSAADLIGSFASLEQVICTDIGRDGMLQGANCELYRELQAAFPAVEIIASGGISDMGDIEELDAQGTRAVVVGKAIYEGRITVKDLKQWLLRG
ncbi:Phosphoribosylformimino-5-aminoimidazole carboxamide ribotide isomerase [Mucinivorans hirudinis]|uniref:1-(5-phosphoribosyl)-5-[(5-phosphoribosylamino)methylideneamino] imidazole-4-carboxamide isomerase n=1 Tax=Mucinivorans hirudinis TaxID=1433126 RepID=A0A060RCM2_9BACT|nr:Phosphoribosylformimino-5-aminoimidazole carboxamide ribotide isomerase [Mucinivorans hirudinis]